MPRRAGRKRQHGAGAKGQPVTDLKILRNEQIVAAKKHILVTATLGVVFSLLLSIWVPTTDALFGIVRFVGIAILTWGYLNMLIISSVKLKYRKKIEGPHANVLRQVPLTGGLAIIEVLLAGALLAGTIWYLRYLLYAGLYVSGTQGIIRLALVALLITLALTLSTEVLIGAYSVVANKPSPISARKGALATSFFLITLFSPVQEILAQPMIFSQTTNLLIMLYGSWVIVLLSETFLKRAVPKRRKT